MANPHGACPPWGIALGQYSERMTDFGAEESFGQAAKRFKEHYGWAINRATVRARSRENSAKSTENCGSSTVHS